MPTLGAQPTPASSGVCKQNFGEFPLLQHMGKIYSRFIGASNDLATVTITLVPKTWGQAKEPVVTTAAQGHTQAQLRHHLVAWGSVSSRKSPKSPQTAGREVLPRGRRHRGGSAQPSHRAGCRLRAAASFGGQTINTQDNHPTGITDWAGRDLSSSPCPAPCRE